ncbi:MAG: hypothetical protein OXI08_09385 [Cyanobacteria bacterium MAG IRC4_bin_6]|nr:hypothetical protein [Cyanobacteria bacterium MAG IRC3_bin_20]MDE0648225.1 hypothetical protein [Cyanobacteria bacterium MAG IRC4_bin_6]
MGMLSVSASTITFSEQDHQLEKLEFALALAVSEGCHDKAHHLRSRIEALGDHGEEPGT